MNRYTHSRPSPLMAALAVVATVATMALAVLAPSKTSVQNGVDGVFAKREARPAQVTITLERVDQTAQPASVAGNAASLPVAEAAVKPRG
jgi:hypothetical protein